MRAEASRAQSLAQAVGLSPKARSALEVRCMPLGAFPFGAKLTYLKSRVREPLSRMQNEKSPAQSARLVMLRVPRAAGCNEQVSVNPLRQIRVVRVVTWVAFV